ncbi:MAG: type II secretion system protein [Burkholderiaceae bacterium]|nr:type II secretion system protein [Burkholderiaceae bacterium]
MSLIELVIFIAVVSAALAGVLAVFIQSTGTSADPMLRRQSLAIAEALLEEASLMPFTFCDGDDPNVATAASTADCKVTEAIGPEAGESRFTTPQFDHVNDYGGYAMKGIVDITNTAVAGLSGYQASVAVTAATLNTMTAASGDVLRISVTVTDPRGGTLTLDGYRTRYAPNASL